MKDDLLRTAHLKPSFLTVKQADKRCTVYISINGYYCTLLDVVILFPGHENYVFLSQLQRTGLTGILI